MVDLLSRDAERCPARDRAIVDVVDNEAVIDLGCFEWDPDRDARPPFSARAVVVWVLAFACLLGLRTASTRDARPGDLLWTVDFDAPVSMVGGTEVVYVVDRADRPHLLAFHGRTGERLWELELPRAPYRVVDLGRGVDALLLRLPTGPSAGQSDATLLVDRWSGVLLANHAGRAVRDTGELAIFEERERRCDDGSARCREVTALDLATGKDLWRLRLPLGARLSAEWPAPDRFLTVGTDGTATLREVTTSAAIANTPPLAAPRAASPNAAPVAANNAVGGWLSAVVADRLVVGRADGSSIDLSGYRSADLRPLWKVRIPSESRTPSTDSGPLELRACGVFVCASDGTGTAVLDAATGVVRVRTPLTIVAALAGGVLVASSHSSLRGALTGTAADLAAVDPTTGQVVTWLPRARLTDVPPPGTGTASKDAVVVIIGERRTGFAVMALDGRLSQLFSLDRSDLRCAVGSAVVSCLDEREGAGLLRGWRLA